MAWLGMVVMAENPKWHKRNGETETHAEPELDTSRNTTPQCTNRGSAWNIEKVQDLSTSPCLAGVCLHQERAPSPVSLERRGD